ncbi:MAG: inorganic phosphate transporter [Elusimicrobia bacterium]|nr:inorganic phosphate transporter [Elusimicrobiota bacterium]
MLSTAIIICSIIYAVSIGANDAANSFGDWIGARIGKPIYGMFLCGGFALLGAFLEGGKVSKTIGSGIIDSSYLTLTVAIIGIAGAILWVILATYFGMPISTTHSIVGGIAGLGLAMGVSINWTVLKKIVVCWLFTPTASFIMAFLVYGFLIKFLTKLKVYDKFEKISGVLLTLTSCYVAYTWGANDVGNSVALVIGSGVLSVKTACVIGGLGIFVGAVLFGWKVSQTIGFEITRITPVMGICSDISTALIIHFFTQFKIPVSTTHALVGAVFGIGFAQNRKLVNLKIGRDIATAWIVTPIVSGVISFCLYYVVKFLF